MNEGGMTGDERMAAQNGESVDGYVHPAGVEVLGEAQPVAWLYEATDGRRVLDFQPNPNSAGTWRPLVFAAGVPAPAAGLRQVGWVLHTTYGPLFEANVTEEQKARFVPVYVADGVRVVGHACKLDGSICESRPDRCSDCPAGGGKS